MTTTALKQASPSTCEVEGLKDTKTSVFTLPKVPQESKTVLPDFDMANRYLDHLTGSTDEPVTFQLFDDRDKQNRRVASHRHMKRNSSYTYLQNKQKQGCGVYVMVNKGNGKGRSKKNVVKIRALFIDLDGSPWEPAAERLRPHIKVESSPGRWHLYWKVSDCSLDQFKPLQQAIIKRFDGDKSCCDLPRVLRVPGFSHLKTDTPFLTRLAESNDLPAYTTQQIIDGLGLEVDKPATATPSPRKQLSAAPAPANSGYEYIDPHSGEVFDLSAWSAKNPHFDIVTALVPQYARGAIKDGKQHIECPFEHEHTETTPDLSTFIANAHLPEYTAFDIHCMHSHCIDRDRLEFLLAMLEKGWLPAEILQAAAPLQMKKPPYTNYPAQEIAATLQLRTLYPEEFRIALHLMHISWLEEDGTLPDNNYMLSRSLGLDENQWQAYRETLEKTGWLIVEDKRLFTPIFRREFTKAQNALMKKITGGSTGGKKAQANR